VVVQVESLLALKLKLKNGRLLPERFGENEVPVTEMAGIVAVCPILLLMLIGALWVPER
jgi:hypothetical protein